MSDLVSRQAAIYALEAKKDKSAKGDIGCFYNTIIQNNIDALKGLPSAQPERNTDGDTISRQAAIDAIKGLPTWWADAGGYYGDAQPPMEALLDPEDAVSAIENLPSAQPKRKTGRWINFTNSNNYMCSVCGRMLVGITDGKNKVAKNYPYCHCGAEMKEEGEE